MFLHPFCVFLLRISYSCWSFLCPFTDVSSSLLCEFATASVLVLCKSIRICIFFLVLMFQLWPEAGPKWSCNWNLLFALKLYFRRRNISDIRHHHLLVASCLTVCLSVFQSVCDLIIRCQLRVSLTVLGFFCAFVVSWILNRP